MLHKGFNYTIYTKHCFPQTQTFRTHLPLIFWNPYSKIRYRLKDVNICEKCIDYDYCTIYMHHILHVCSLQNEWMKQKVFQKKQWPVTMYYRTTYRTFAIDFIKLILFRNVHDLLCFHHVIWCVALVAMCHLIC